MSMIQVDKVDIDKVGLKYDTFVDCLLSKTVPGTFGIIASLLMILSNVALPTMVEER